MPKTDDPQDAPLRTPRQTVDDDTELRIRPDERTPPEGHEAGPVEVPESEWEEHGRRSDTAHRLARDQPPVE